MREPVATKLCVAKLAKLVHSIICAHTYTYTEWSKSLKEPFSNDFVENVPTNWMFLINSTVLSNLVRTFQF